jgi:hypothetical protein
MQRIKINSGGAQSENENTENRRGLTRGRPQIISTPAQSLWRILVNGKTDDQPNRKNDPGIWVRELQLPDIPSDEARERHAFDKIEIPSPVAAVHALIISRNETIRKGRQESDV